MHKFGRRFFNKNELELPPNVDGVIIYSGYSTEIAFKKCKDKMELLLNIRPVCKVFSSGNIYRINYLYHWYNNFTLKKR